MADYAEYRDIYPQEFYQKILIWAVPGRAEGPGPLGRASSPAEPVSVRSGFTGIDISENQIGQAKKLAEEGLHEYTGCL